MSLAQTASRAIVEGMTDGTDSAAWKDLAVSALVFLVYVAIILLFGKYLWNTAICRMISVAKPVDSVFYILGLMLFVGLILPSH